MEKNEQLFIPTKCKVGFNERGDTYTGKLGYIIYNDGKVWRKEKSWEGWRQKPGDAKYGWDPVAQKQMKGKHDESVEAIEFENVPTAGFVLNKKAGGGNSGWNHRQTYSRVYDPRGWEFEITVPNLLYILQESNSYKGKGLEGEFVYSWDGKDLVLIPTSSADYKASIEYTNLQSVKFNRKDLTEGHTYLTNKQEKFIYLGRYPVYDCSYSNLCPLEVTREVNTRTPQLVKKHVFKPVIHCDYTPYEFLTSFSRLKKRVSDDVHPEFADYVDEFLNSEYASLSTHLIVAPFSKEAMKDLGGWGSKVFKIMDIKTIDDYRSARKSLRKAKDADKNEIKGVYETYVTETVRGRYSWYDEDKHIVDGKFTLKELKKKYGMLIRVYNNGFKKEV